MGQPMTRGKGNVFRRRKEKEKEKGKEGDIPQMRAHQAIQDGWQTYPFNAQTTKEKRRQEEGNESTSIWGQPRKNPIRKITKMM